MPMEPVATDFGAFLQEMLDDNEQYLREKRCECHIFCTGGKSDHLHRP